MFSLPIPLDKPSTVDGACASSSAVMMTGSEVRVGVPIVIAPATGQVAPGGGVRCWLYAFASAERISTVETT
jgi:hypothetical protein